MSGHIGPKLLAVLCILAGALTASRAGAQTAAPVAGQSTSPDAPPAAAAEAGKGTDCSTKPKSAAGGASLVQATGESLQHKRWQPTGGEIQFTVKSFVPIPPDASVVVCFRWESDPESKRAFVSTRPSRLDLEGDGKLLKVTTTVPDLGPQPNDVEKALPLVPLAEVRILAINNKKEAVAEATTAIGITHPTAAFAFALATVGLGLWVLYIAARWRLKDYLGIQKANWFLRIISTPSGFASLSQLQIVLWTFVVAASAVYVMSLSGQLIDITAGTLVLLGIAGAAGIGAKAHTESQAATAEAKAAKAAADKAAADIDVVQKAAAATAAPADPVAAEAHKQAVTTATVTATAADAAKANADGLKKPPATQVPQWSDLIVNESIKDDGTKTREIDVARFQMLLFTLVTAVFVLMSVVTNYVIPEISAGFQTLMGISNGVYLGSKIAQG